MCVSISWPRDPKVPVSSVHTLGILCVHVRTYVCTGSPHTRTQSFLLRDEAA